MCCRLPSEAGEGHARQRLLFGVGAPGRELAAGPRAGIGVAQADPLSSGVLGAGDGLGSHSHQTTAAQLPAAKGVPAAQRDLPSDHKPHPELIRG